MKRQFSVFLVILLAVGAASLAVDTQRSTFTAKDNRFLFNGKPFRIFSGEMHYPRIPAPYWQDRLQKARAMGLNTVCTYVFWNAHEPRPGEFRFDGNLDIAKFIRMAQAEGLLVILRPGPYVCSEWDFGGLPAWLLKDPEIKVRCMYPPYLEAAKRYLLRLGRELQDLQIGRGGPIIALQVENEYGSYGNDRKYTKWLAETLREAGFEVLFTTSDGGADFLLESGALENALPVVNFGGEPQKEFSELDKFRKNIPHMCGEYWCGWFTQWGHKEWGHSDIDAQAKEVGWMLENDKSFNFYMFHGGTNFGFYAGANHYDGKYWPDITSYDYGAPLSEDGKPTRAYFNYRKLLGRYLEKGQKLPRLPAPIPGIEIPVIATNRVAPLFSNLGSAVHSIQPQSMECYGQDFGYILYRTRLVGPKQGKLVITELRDYAQVYLNGNYIGKIDRRNNENSIEIPESNEKNRVLDILVEALGRINFGFKLQDRKGITENVTLRGITLMDWEVYSLPMDAGFIQKLQFSDGTKIAGPGFFKGTFRLDFKKPGDCFLDMRQWKKGVVWINGINLGRYWPAEGPQYDVYVPGCWLKKGENEILIFDLAQQEASALKAVKARAPVGMEPL